MSRWDRFNEQNGIDLNSVLRFSFSNPFPEDEYCNRDCSKCNDLNCKERIDAQ